MNAEEIFGVIVRNLQTIDPDIKKGIVRYDSKLCLLGVGSVGRAELIEMILEELELKIDRFEFHSASNLGELSYLLFEKMNTKSA